MPSTSHVPCQLEKESGNHMLMQVLWFFRDTHWKCQAGIGTLKVRYSPDWHHTCARGTRIHIPRGRMLDCCLFYIIWAAEKTVMIINTEKLDELVNRIISGLPRDLDLARKDIEKNLKSAISAGLARMDLVTREEYDIQLALLQRTREKLENLEKKLTDLEEQLNRQ
jgi:BMFP domain-containing protein YqiC